jgi:hypothetical protein
VYGGSLMLLLTTKCVQNWYTSIPDLCVGLRAVKYCKTLAGIWNQPPYPPSKLSQNHENKFWYYFYILYSIFAAKFSMSFVLFTNLYSEILQENLDVHIYPKYWNTTLMFFEWCIPCACISMTGIYVWTKNVNFNLNTADLLQWILPKSLLTNI